METTYNELISVIIPTYKSPQALDLCLKSCIENQVNKNEIIVIVDGFYNLTEKVLEKYKSDIVVYQNTQNQGLTRSTNVGVLYSTKERILVVNDDNVFPKDWDIILNKSYKPNSIISPNQIEPYPSMFKQFIIKDFGRTIEDFKYDDFINFTSNYKCDNVLTEDGSSLPFFMSREDYLKVGGWDEFYRYGMVADWDFFLKCDLNNIQSLRNNECLFYHFVSLTTKTPEEIEKRQQAERQGHEYAKLKWKSYILHNPSNNKKYLINK